ncbi:MAG: helix-hairpin-helix domain-containing protein [Planctomycetes bacterium]|nr:helix-hairpin-helix domain-containing protein [Planctomycetota bacterium]
MPDLPGDPVDPAQRRGAGAGARRPWDRAAGGPPGSGSQDDGADPPVVNPARVRLLLAAWACLVLGLSIRAFARGLVGDRRGPEVTLQPVVVDLNAASVAELSLLPGIGRTRAEAIVLDRVRHGPFPSVEDLARVDGIGAKTVEALREFVACGADPLATPR